MAITKIHPIKSTLIKALEYIQEPSKTDDKLLISTFGCSYETADIEFQFTLDQSIDKGNNLAHHLIQSFEPGEVSYAEAHEIGKELADKVLKGQHEYVLTTHVDKGHIHNHLIFCAANFVNYHKYNSNKKSYYNIRNINDKLCKEHGLSVIEPSNNKGKSYKEYSAIKAGTSWKAKLKISIDSCISTSKTYEDFLIRMETLGYKIKKGKYLSFKAKEQGRFTRSKTLGEDYSIAKIIERINDKSPRKKSNLNKIVVNDSINLMIDIHNHLKCQESKGYEHWAKINNLKQAAKTMAFLTENNITTCKDLKDKIDAITSTYDSTRSAIKDIENRISNLSLIIKYADTYNKLKPIYDKYQKTIFKGKYQKEYESDLILFDTARKALKKTKLLHKTDISVDTKLLKTEYKSLISEKDKLYKNYSNLKKDVKKYDLVKKNIELILNSDLDKNLESSKSVSKEKDHNKNL